MAHKSKLKNKLNNDQTALDILHVMIPEIVALNIDAITVEG